MPDWDYVITAPTDCILNMVPQRITDLKAEILNKFKIYEPGPYSFGGIKVRLGNQIGIFDTPHQ